MKKKLTLLLVFALVLTMIPAPASAALKSAGSPTEVQTLVSGENLEHNFVKVTADGSTLRIETSSRLTPPTVFGLDVSTRMTWEITVNSRSHCRTQPRAPAL